MQRAEERGALLPWMWARARAAPTAHLCWISAQPSPELFFIWFIPLLMQNRSLGFQDATRFPSGLPPPLYGITHVCTRDLLAAGHGCSPQHFFVLDFPALCAC